MPALFAVAVPEAVLFIQAGEERLDLLRVRELIADHDHGRGARFDSQSYHIEHFQASGDTRDDVPDHTVAGAREIVLSVEAVLAQLLESADIWFEREDALVDGRQFSTGAVDDTA